MFFYQVIKLMISSQSKSKQHVGSAATAQINDFRDATTDTDDSSAASKSSRFECYLPNKSGKLHNYELEVGKSHILIISSSKQKVKAKLTTTIIHAKE